MSGEMEPSAPTPPEGSPRGGDDVRRTDPDDRTPHGSPPPPPASITDPDELAPSSVRASAPTMQNDTQSSAPRVVQVRTPPPQAASYPPPHIALDNIVGAPSTTTPTGRDPSMAIVSSGKSPTSSPRGLIGATLGRYEIIEELGHGGMATVYRAHDPRLDRMVALKVIHAHLRENTEIAQRFRHEARAVAKLKHRSIVEIYDVPDEESGERFLVAEYVDGPSLRRWLQTAQRERGNERGPLMPPEIAAAVILQVLSALSRAHAEGIIHRDVKPENILISGLGAPTSQRPSDPNRAMPMVKLTDFGIAKILDAGSMTSTGQILGSPAHMAPEQIEGGDIGPRVDIFATGVLFYELLTGTLPFDGKNPAQVIRRVLEGNFTAADRVAPTVGGRWSAIVASMLAREPEKRPVDVDELASHMRKELEAIGVVDPDRELVDFLNDPVGVSAGWGARVKPKLLERALAAREAGDVMSAAHDLNRALSYDPSDPKLVRAVSTIRTRERRLRTARRVAPIVLIGALIAGGTFFGVRALQTRHPPIGPSADPNARNDAGLAGTAVTTTSTTSVPTAPSSKSSVDAAAPSVGTSVGTGSTTAPTGTNSGTVAHATREVHVILFPASATFSIDGGPPLDTLAGDVQVPIGEHTFSASGPGNCCAPWSQRIKIVAEDAEHQGAQVVNIHLGLNPARIFVENAPDGVAVTVTVRNKAGAVIASGPQPLPVQMTDTTIPVTIVLEAPGLPTKSVEMTLSPGDADYVRL